jgi:xylulose-5-phosphate/fructose-6-phosphate phosphoketolase
LEREPLRLEHVKPRLLGHWGTTPGLNFVYAHLNRVIRREGLGVIYVTGPGHGGRGWWPASGLRAPTGRSTPTSAGTRRGCGGCSASSRSRAASPATWPPSPGVDQRGRRARATPWCAYGAAFDNPDLLVCCAVGDGEAETGPLAASWHSSKFLDPVRDGWCCRSCT